MSTITITVTATAAEFATFADELFYPTEVSKTPGELALLTEPIAIEDRVKPNPQSRETFLTLRFKELLAAEIAKAKVAAIERVVNTAKETDKENMRVAVRDRVGVTYTV